MDVGEIDRAWSCMCSIVSKNTSAGLLFDEPSASLDPVFEHGEDCALGLLPNESADPRA